MLNVEIKGDVMRLHSLFTNKILGKRIYIMVF